MVNLEKLYTCGYCLWNKAGKCNGAYFKDGAWVQMNHAVKDDDKSCLTYAYDDEKFGIYYEEGEV